MTRFIVPFLFAALAGVSSPAFASSLLLTPSTLAPIEGESFTIDVSVIGTLAGRPAGDEVIFFGFDTTNSDETIASLSNVVVAPLFLDDSGAFPGTDVNGTAALPGPVVSDPLLLARLTFLAVKPGVVTLGTRSDLSDPNEGLQFLLDATAHDLTGTVTVNVQAAHAVPEPSSPALGAAGLVVLIAGRRLASRRPRRPDHRR